MRLSKRKLSKKRVKSRKSRKQRNHSKKRLRKQISKRYSRKKKNKLTKRRNKKGGVNLRNIIFGYDEDNNPIVKFRGLYRRPNNEEGNELKKEKNTCYFNSTINFLLASNFLRTIIKEKQEYIQGDNYLKDFFDTYFNPQHVHKISAANFIEEGKSKNLIKWEDGSGEKFHEGESGEVSDIYQYLFKHYFPLISDKNICAPVINIIDQKFRIYGDKILQNSMEIYQNVFGKEISVLNKNIINQNFIILCQKKPPFLIIELKEEKQLKDLNIKENLELNYVIVPGGDDIIDKEDTEKNNYILKSIILFIDGHFTTFVKYNQPEWIYIDDMMVDTFENYKKNDEDKHKSDQKYNNINQVDYIQRNAKYFLYEREDLVENVPNSEANINKELSENFIKSKTCRGQK